MQSLPTEERLTEAPPRTGPSSQLPEAHRILGWVYGGRVSLGIALFLRASLGLEQPPDTAFWSTVLVGTALLFTAGSFWYTHRLRQHPGRAFLFSEIFFDALFLTGVVYLTGGQESIFAPLYILVICAAALLLPMLGGFVIGLLASLLYLAAALSATPPDVSGAIFLQVALFAIVALVTGYLGDRLRQTGAALGEVETELRLLRLDTGDILSTISTGILTVDGDGRLAYVNPAAEELLELKASEWMGRPILDRLDRIAPGLGSIIDRSATTRTGVRRYETEPITEDSFVLGVSTTLVERPSEERPPITAIFQDITEKKRVEALRRRAERLEAVAGLSASLAHEIKNPLASIRSAVEQIAGGSLEPEDAQVLKDLALRESDRLSRLLSEFIDFARVKVTAPAPVDLAALLGGVVDLVRAHPDASGRRLEVAISTSADAAWIRGAEDLLHRAIFNLVLNAAQWAGDDGVVNLSLDEVRSDLLSPAIGALGLIRLTVSDTGPGVPEEIREQIFDPFFTRRPGGSGLGLALVQRAVEAHGGAIFVDNAPAGSGLGATFTLYLPGVSAPQPRNYPAPAAIQEATTP